jgi:hypothetical protein
VVIAEGRIPLAAECVTTPVISDPHIASTIIGGVLCAVDREVSIPIDRYVIATAKLIRVAGAINLGIPCSVDREVSLTINRYAVPSTRLVRIAITINIVSRPSNGEIPVAIYRCVTWRANLLFPLEVPITHPFVPREVSFSNRAQSGVVFDHGIGTAARLRVRSLPILRGRNVTMRAHGPAGVRRSCGMNIRCSMLRARSLRLSLVVIRSPRCERQREASNAY